MTTAHQHASHDHYEVHGETVSRTFHADLACIACAEAVERALHANPHIAGVHVDYPARRVHVSYHAGMIDPAQIQELISASAHGCRCAPEDEPDAAVGGKLESLAHHADMAAVTMGTSADRMQYEFPSTSAGKQHGIEHHGDHEGAAATPAGEQGAHAGHGAMGHDMSDPRMAKAMEADMRNRFLVALLLTIPTVLFSPLAMNTFGIHLVEMRTANWLMLLFSTPVVWWAGWPFIGGAVTSLRYRTLNMSVLIATSVLAPGASACLSPFPAKARPSTRRQRCW